MFGWTLIAKDAVHNSSHLLEGFCRTVFCGVNVQSGGDVGVCEVSVDIDSTRHGLSF